MMHRNPVSLEHFLTAVASGEPMLTVLNLKASEFLPYSFEQLMENAHDVGLGVTAVSRKTDMLFFGLFTQLEVKEHSDGSIRYLFTGIVRETATISHLAVLLQRIFGQGIHSPDDLHQPFTRTDTLAILTSNTWCTLP